ncbi:phytanoyl-CoA dioxygenase family protein [Nitzschia inconspicua]|uniref:Phytanoyl-CoA dioxygenase family protein n=1 Tax=Nitzschia inconspicua TaxID=303405 RepID=A0A9K3PCD8_9STRA|nr:phytanoyl-CoA dioxygenase family protein [Nitzschia inconspicua]
MALVIRVHAALGFLLFPALSSGLLSNDFPSLGHHRQNFYETIRIPPMQHYKTVWSQKQMFRTPGNPSRLCASTVPADEIPSLYKEQERLLVERGIVEAELMKSTASPIQPNISKGTGTAKGFASNTALAGTKPADLKAAAKIHAEELKKSGVVRIDNVLTNENADHLREYVFNLRKSAEEQVRNAEVKTIERFADVLLKENRCDLTIPLEDELVVDSLLWILQKTPVVQTVSSILGKDAGLYELSCLISDPGSQRQVTHPDTPCNSNTDDPVLYTCFIALQDITVDMGPTTWIPYTHNIESHEQFQDETPNAFTGESPKDALLRTKPSVLGLLPKGSCAIFDSRVIHCGGSNTSNISRALFYCSFKSPKVGYPGNPGSIRRELQSKFTVTTLEKELKKLQKQR